MRESLVRDIRTFLVDDSPEFLSVLCQLLAGEAGFTVVGQALTGLEALEEVPRLQPDLVLMDLNMPRLNGLEATRRLKADAGAPRVVIVTLHDDAVYQEAARAVGADGLISKSKLHAQLLPLLRGLFGAPPPPRGDS